MATTGQEGAVKKPPPRVPRSKLGRAVVLAEASSTRKAAPADEDVTRAGSMASRVDARLRAMFDAKEYGVEDEKGAKAK
jgi:hypothetical protein